MLHQEIITPTQRAALDRRKRLMGNVVPIHLSDEAKAVEILRQPVTKPERQFLPKVELPPPVIPPVKVIYHTSWPVTPAYVKRGSVPTVRLVLGIVAEFYDTTITHIMSARRALIYVKPRHVAMYLCAHLTHLSLPEIGRRMGGRDHTSIMHGRDKIARLILQSDAIARDIVALRTKINDVVGGSNVNS